MFEYKSRSCLNIYRYIEFKSEKSEKSEKNDKNENSFKL